MRGVHLGLVASLFVLITGCMTPMAQRDIDELTTCNNTDLKALRKNLLLNGYAVVSQSDDDIVTDYKQEGRNWSRVTVIKVDDKTFKFKVRNRREGYEQAPTGSTLTTISSNDGRRVQAHSQGSQTFKTTDENDQVYYVEQRAQHEATRSAVCGR